MPKTILVVDYEQRSIEEIRELLKDEGFSLLTASDGNQAMEVFAARVPDLVLTAALLPKINGFDLCKKITSGQMREVRPVIMFSAIYKAEKYRKEATIGCGAIEFLEKPLAKWQLIKVIKTAFSEIPVAGSRNVVRTEAPEVLVYSAPILDVPNFSTLAATGDDLLEVDDFFDTKGYAVAVQNVPVEKEDTLLGNLLHEVQPPVISANDSAEIDAAMDAFRIDVEKEVRLRDEQIVQEIEGGLVRDGPNILEFEGPVTDPHDLPTTDSGAEVETFELDGISLESSETKDLETASEEPAPPAEELLSQVMPSIDFTIKSTESRNWLPVIILCLVVLLAGLFFWFRN